MLEESNKLSLPMTKANRTNGNGTLVPSEENFSDAQMLEKQAAPSATNIEDRQASKKH